MVSPEEMRKQQYLITNDVNELMRQYEVCRKLRDLSIAQQPYRRQTTSITSHASSTVCWSGIGHGYP